MPFDSIILLEIHYLPCIQYFSKFNRFEKVTIEQFEHYSKGSFRNRAHIAGANGITRLSIPLEKGKNEQQPIRETRIAWYEPWAKRHWQAIQSAYGNAPYFEFYCDELRPFFDKKYTFLFDWNMDLIIKFNELVQLGAVVECTQSYSRQVSEGVVDFRNRISPKVKRAFPDPDFNALTYAQVFTEKHGFLPNLSILDLLFCTGPEAINYL